MGQNLRCIYIYIFLLIICKLDIYRKHIKLYIQYEKSNII
jgi:hypothetical protein